MKKIFVSVIVPVYNVACYLDKCVESVVGQTLQDIEIILVDDGATDGSGEIIDKWARQDNRIIAIHKKNEGVTIARNTGLGKANGEYIFFLDGDDYLIDDALETMYNCAREQDADWIVGDFLLIFPQGKVERRQFPDFGVVNNVDFLRYCFGSSDFYYTGRLIRRNFLSRARLSIPKEITFGEDNLAVTQLASQINKAAKVVRPVLCYVQRETSVTNLLKTSDLHQRAYACFLCLEFLRKQDFWIEIKDAVESYFIKEYVASLSRGYVDDYMKRVVSVCHARYRDLDKKNWVLYTLAGFLGVSLTIGIIKKMKSVKKYIKSI